MTLPPQKPKKKGPSASNASERVRIAFERDKDALSRFLMRALNSRDHAEDVLQEIYLRLMKQEVKTPGKEFSRSYLFVTATNIIRDRRRREWVRKKAGREPLSKEIEHIEPVDPYPTAEAQLVWRDGVSIVKEALGTIKPIYAEIFMLHWGEGMTMVEISKQTDIPVRSVERYASHALSHCKKALERRNW